MEKSRPQHLMRYGLHAEQRYFTGAHFDKYDAVVLNANLVAHTPQAFAVFVSERAATKSFLVDPLTHAFQHSPDLLLNKAGDVKASVERMSTAYGCPVSEKVGKLAVVPSDFYDEARRHEFCKRVIDFQLDVVDPQVLSEDLKRFYDFAGKELPKPVAITPPYFYLEAATAELWLPINVSMASYAKEAFPDQSLYVQIVLSKDVLLDEACWGSTADEYAALPVDTFLVWVDDMPEDAVGPSLLESFARFVARLKRNRDRRVMNLYGGYFSAMLCSAATGPLLDGVCHGLEYGESRPVVSVGGGIPISKYYHPDLHTRLRMIDVVRMIDKTGWNKDPEVFFANVCGCPVCRKVINGDVARFAQFGESRPSTFVRRGQTVVMEFPTVEARDKCVRHYLECKAREFKTVSSARPAELVSGMLGTYDQYAELLGLSAVAHLKHWANIIDRRTSNVASGEAGSS